MDVHRLEYASLDEVAVDATGKQLWELEIGDREIGLVKKKLWGTKMESLHCIRDNAHARYRGAHELSDEQATLRRDNINVLMKEALLPTIEMRESEAKCRPRRLNYQNHTFAPPSLRKLASAPTAVIPVEPPAGPAAVRGISG